MSLVESLLAQRQYLLNAVEALTGGPESPLLARAITIGFYPPSAVFVANKWLKQVAECVQTAGEPPTANDDAAKAVEAYRDLVIRYMLEVAAGYGSGYEAVSRCLRKMADHLRETPIDKTP